MKLRVGTLLICVGLAVLGSPLVSTAAAATPTVSGTWSCCGAGGASAQTFTITQSGSSLSGSASAGGEPFSPISGSVSGTSVTIVTGPYTHLPSYTATFVGSISADGETMSGTWSSTASQTGTWTATRTGGSPTTVTPEELAAAKEAAEKASEEAREASESEDEIFESYEDCPAPEKPEDDLTTPIPPAGEEAGAAAAVRGIAAAIPMPTGEPPAYCDYKAKYTKQEKDAAHAWSVYYNDQAAILGKGAAGLGVFTGLGGLAPGPAAAKGIFIVYGTVLTGATAYMGADASQSANLMASIEHDPPDHAWHTISARLKTRAYRIPKGAELKAGGGRHLRALFAALQTRAADSTCEQDAINRATTALVHKQTKIAAEQYHAGAACANEAAASAKLLPPLISSAKATLLPLARRLSTGAPLKRLRKLERNVASRRRVARRIAKELGRTISLPATSLEHIEQLLAAPGNVASPATTLSQAFSQFAAENQAWETLQLQTAQVLSAAARR